MLYGSIIFNICPRQIPPLEGGPMEYIFKFLYLKFKGFLQTGLYLIKSSCVIIPPASRTLLISASATGPW